MSAEAGQVFLAKPSGVTLDDHTQHLRDQFERHILPAHRFAQVKYERLTNGKNLSALTLQAIRWHDIGKKHPRWQEACQKDNVKWREWNDAGRRGKEPPGVCLRKTGIRHEMSSLARMLHNVPDVSPVVQVAVAAHHGKLSERYSERWRTDDEGKYLLLWRAFRGISDELDYVDDWLKALHSRYEYAGPRALLQLADHRASAGEEGAYLPDFAPFTYQFPYNERHGPQQSIADLWDEPIALLRAATGAGKTDAALLWAQHQIEMGRADRLVIAMPTRFTANALAISNAGNLSKTGLHHSTAWYQKRLEEGGQSYEGRNRAKAEQEMARLLETPITVTTLDHLCICLTATREDHHAAFFNLAHSCVVIDESDFYDDFTQANVVILLAALRELQVPTLLMSATLPESCKALYSVPQIHEDATDYERPRCSLTRFDKPAIKPSNVAALLQPALNGTPTIIYANTVQRAQRYYRYLLSKEMADDKIVLYHSRFAEPHKVAIEERLRGMLGRDAWKADTQHGVAILTQIGELSVNISADYMISDLCPLDRLVQRIGRLSRFPESKRPGVLHVVTPHKQNKEGVIEPYPAPYGTYRKGWQPAPALTATDALLENGDYSAKDFVRLVNKLYENETEMPVDARENQRLFRELIGMNWLIQKENDVKEDADQTKDWRCRDIDFQHTLLVGVKKSYIAEEDDTALANYEAWRTLLLEHGVNCQAYEYHRALEQGRLEEVTYTIGDSGGGIKEKIYLVHDNCYNSRTGLSFDDPEDEEDDEQEI